LVQRERQSGGRDSHQQPERLVGEPFVFRSIYGELSLSGVNRARAHFIECCARTILPTSEMSPCMPPLFEVSIPRRSAREVRVEKRIGAGASPARRQIVHEAAVHGDIPDGRDRSHQTGTHASGSAKQSP
jgi:hypothetical protein